ncbi:hypothetical protein LARI1_G008224 [Lachnellula arida]|uniref:BTB domain-containing protein n=1 Tax=Lachnellula arida TaxID=1316785 RepID=A0A8T9B584_9HELO|nr:hypothetical protein LARI1_G008224 [Lachnellula arida]
MSTNNMSTSSMSTNNMSTNNMSANNDPKSMSDALPYDDFMKSLLPMFSGPQVTIRVGENGPAYHISKNILCTNSPYFSAMFAAGHFKEGAEDSAVLEEIEGVVTPGSFQALVQWLYRGRVTFPVSLEPKEEISQILEFVRLADMAGVTGVDDAMSERLRAQPVDVPPPPNSHPIPSYPPTWYPQPPLPPNAQPLPPHFAQNFPFNAQAMGMAPRHPNHPPPQTSSHRTPGQNTAYITSLHIAHASELHPDNPVRRMVAKAAVEGYLRNPDFEFQDNVTDTPSFARDLLREVQETLHGPEAGYFVDPITGKAFLVGS